MTLDHRSSTTLDIENSTTTGRTKTIKTKNKEVKFLYIDRVVIKESHRRRGAGSYLYEHLYDLGKKEGIPLCCEVNIIPKNQISLNFHYKKGFKDDGEREFKDHSVRYLKK